MVLVPDEYDLARMRTTEVKELIEAGRPVVVLLPVGSVEPHGPHLPLETDTIISVAACVEAATALDAAGVSPLIAPSVPYGVTDCAGGFAGAVSVPHDAVVAYLQGVIDGLLHTGVAHVCLVNNHLEPGHDLAVREAAGLARAEGRASVACPLTKRWGRTLDSEYKSGACHAGSYETSILMAAAPETVNEDTRRRLPEVPVSLSEKLREGISDFVEMGMRDAYSGAPMKASAEHGREMIGRLATMVHTEVLEALGISGDDAD
jgi:creatinine amidohydrolase